MRAAILLFLLTALFGFIDCTDTVSDVTNDSESKELKKLLRAQKKARRQEKKEKKLARLAAKEARKEAKLAKKAKRLAKKEAKKAEQAAEGITVTVAPRLTDTETTTVPPVSTTMPPVSTTAASATTIATTTLPAAQNAVGNSCNFPAVKVNNDILVLNDGSDRRFFVAGMVDNVPASGKQLHRYDHEEMKQIMIDHKKIGANTMRWNAFLKGADITWDENGLVTGVQPGCIEALVDGLDLAQEYGILVQIVLSSTHFLRWGEGGEFGALTQGDTNVPNKLRVDNNYKMFTTEEGTKAYIENLIKPMAQRIGKHPALFGYVIVNEGNGMTIKPGSDHGIWSDKQMSYEQLLTWVNQVAGALNRATPGVILSAPIIAKLSSWWEDDELIGIGGDNLGILHIHQHQYYPDKHHKSFSPFLNSAAAMNIMWKTSTKPSVAGEFPIEGLKKTTEHRNPDYIPLVDAYDRLWNGGHSGGFCWNYERYSRMTPDREQKVLDAYDHVNTALLQGLTADLDC